MLVEHTQEVVSAHVAGTTPYAWPWNGRIDGRGTAVLVVSPSTAIPDASPEQIARVTEATYSIVSVGRSIGATIIRVITTPPAHATSGLAAWFPSLVADATVTSAGIDGFFGSALEPTLRSGAIERILLVGAGLETCVHSTMRSANDRGFECLLVRDASLPYDHALVASAVSMIEMSGGIFGAVGTTSAVIDALTPLPPIEGTTP